MNSNRLISQTGSKATFELLKATPNKQVSKANPQFQFVCCLDKTALKFYSERKIQLTQAHSPQSFKLQVVFLLSYLFKEDKTGFLSLAEKFVRKDWNEMKLKVCNRLNKLSYLEPSLKFKTFQQIEKQMINEWRKNHLLYGLQALWNHSIRAHRFQSLQQLQACYNNFRTFIAQAICQKFRQCVNVFEQKKYPFMNKLENQTAVYIITGNKQWRKIYNQKIEPFLEQISINFSQNFNLRSLEANQKILNIHSNKPIFSKTSKSLGSFCNTLKLTEKIETLKEFRKNLLQEIVVSIQINRSQGDKPITVEKEDILACVIYTLVKFKLDDIGKGLRYLSFILGKGIDEILSGAQVDCFRTDLEAAYEFITTPVVFIDQLNHEYQSLETSSSSY